MSRFRSRLTAAGLGAAPLATAGTTAVVGSGLANAPLGLQAGSAPQFADVGFCLRNNGSAPISNNNLINGWVQVTS